MLSSAPQWATLCIGLLPVALGAVHERLAAVPKGWQSAGSVSEGSVAQFTVALNREFEGLEKRLLDVSTPGSPNYGKFLDRDEVEAIFPIPKDAAPKVLAWLKANGVTDYKVDGGFIDFSVSVDNMNNALNASYQYFKSGEVTKLRTLQYSVPDDLKQYIAFFDPGTFFGNVDLPSPFAVATPPPSARSRFRQRDDNCATGITPACINKLYNLGDYQADAKSGSRIGFGSFLDESASFSDLAKFQQYYNLPSQNFTKDRFQDPKDGSFGEANLDVQNIMAVAKVLPVTEILTGGSPPFIPTRGVSSNTNEPYVPFYRYLLSKKNDELPQVISQSYGDEEKSVPEDYARLSCNLAGLMGLRGITLIISSGDFGLGNTCVAPDNKTLEFSADFPGSCPYVTAIGGTSGSTVPELSWDGSGGGFSSYFSRPQYQDTAVGAYLAKEVSDATKTYYGQYTNFSGRAIPDISAHSLDPGIAGFYNGQKRYNGGTSASAPIVAGIVGLLNDARLRTGKSVLGWLNPLIYQIGNKAFVDVTEGFAPGCTGGRRENGAKIPGLRWNATASWDPVTGFGTPDFMKWKDLVLKL